MLAYIVYYGLIFAAGLSSSFLGARWNGRRQREDLTRDFDLRTRQLEARLKREREDFRAEGEKFVKDATDAFEKIFEIRWPTKDP